MAPRIKVPDEFTVTVMRHEKGWAAFDGSGSGFGKTPREALTNFAEGLEVGTRINQSIALQNADMDKAH